MFLIVNCFHFRESNVIAAEWLFFPTSPVLSYEEKNILNQDFFFKPYINFVTAVKSSYQVSKHLS